MIDCVILTVAEFACSVKFYIAVLKPLGVTDVIDYPSRVDHPHLKGFDANGQLFFWLKEGEARPDAMHVGFVAPSRAKVKEFFEAAVAAGGGIKTVSGLQHQYFADYFAAWVIDPDGHDIEIVNKTGQAE